MLTATRPFLLAGETYLPGVVVPPAVWTALTVRTRKVLERSRFVRSTDLAPLPRTRGRPRKES